MNWYTLRNQDVEGPFSPEEFQRQVDQGIIGRDTLVWREGFANWVPWGTLGSREAQTWRPEQYLERDLRTPVGPILSEAWAVYGRDLGPLVLAICVNLLLVMASAVMGWLVSLLIPFAGMVVGILVQAPLQVGLQWAFLRRLRGYPFDMGAMFSVFGPRYAQVVLQQVVLMTFLFPALVLMVLGFGAMVLGAVLIQGGVSLPQFLPAIGEGMAIVLLLAGAGVGMVGMLVYFYLLVSWFYAPLLVFDRGLAFWDAMVLSWRVANRHPWLFSWFLLVASVVSCLGCLLCGIGILLTAPLGLLMLVAGYERLYGQLDIGR